VNGNNNDTGGRGGAADGVEMIIVDVWSKESKEPGDHHVF